MWTWGTPVQWCDKHRRACTFCLIMRHIYYRYLARRSSVLKKPNPNAPHYHCDANLI